MKIYERFKVTITVMIVFVISAIFSGLILKATEMTKGIIGLIDIINNNREISITVIILTIMIVLITIDTIRYSINKKDKEEER